MTGCSGPKDAQHNKRAESRKSAGFGDCDSVGIADSEEKVRDLKGLTWRVW